VILKGQIMIVLAIIISCLISYLLGSCNSAIITVRLFEHKDIRDYGSHNAGLTNTLRCFGKKCALFTLLGDLLKGVAAVLLSKFVCVLLGAADSIGADNIVFMGYVAGLAAIFGHVFPLYYHFKGGKGVLVGVSVFLVIDWRTFLILIGIFALVLAVTKYVSVGSITGAACAPVVTFVTQYFSSMDLNYVILDTVLAACMGIWIIFMHRSNI
jgi:glycerol-3-phosphate acyltransferase PlsY